jgi:two-component system, chemotaxis family, response regulator Rcp1
MNDKLRNGVRTLRILLVEDNPADVRLTEEVLSEVAIPSELTTVSNGENAIACLRREGSFAGAVLPDIILLDLNLPKKDGREVLAEIKGDPALKSIPVIVLTTSRAEQDVRAAYDLHANCYIVKPLDLDQFLSVVRSTVDFWFNIVCLPPE